MGDYNNNTEIATSGSNLPGVCENAQLDEGNSRTAAIDLLEPSDTSTTFENEQIEGRTSKLDEGTIMMQKETSGSPPEDMEGF